MQTYFSVNHIEIGQEVFEETVLEPTENWYANRLQVHAARFLFRLGQ